MRKQLVAGAIGAAAVAAAISLAAPAQADYLQGATYQSVLNGICNYLDGKPTLQGVSNLSWGAHGLSNWGARQFSGALEDAVIDVCPRHKRLVSVWLNADNRPDWNPHDAPSFPLWVTS